MLKICLSYDYELFLGKNLGTYDEILFQPTQKLSDMMQEHGARGTFFADVCSAIVHRKYGLDAYPEAFDAQLRQLTEANHDIQLHIHSNWYYAKPKNGILNLDNQGYRIHEFGFDRKNPNSASQIISEGKHYLESVCCSVNPDYKCVGYRAGGFAFQPEKELIQALVDNDIKIDSSVVPYMSAQGVINAYDYREVPRILNWWIDSQYGVNVASFNHENAMFEVPVATARPRLLKLLKTKKEQRSLPREGKIQGEYATADKALKVSTSRYLRVLHTLFDYRYISLDSRHYERVLEDLEFFYNKHKLWERDGYICLICHPKLADQVRIDNIERLISGVMKDRDKYSFVTISDIYNEVIAKVDSEGQV